MKNQFTSLVFLMLLLVSGINLSAKKWRVNNNTGVNANYTTLTDAVSAASAGDTIYLECSITTYASPDSIKKKLTIIGPGYFLTENDTTQACKQGASVDNITFGKGSEGSLLTGITVNNTIYINTSNIIIARNYVANEIVLDNTNSPISNIVIKQNYIAAYIAQNAGTNIATNVLIYNNIVNTIGIGNTSSTFICMNNAIFGSAQIYNAEYFNNICYYEIAGSLNYSHNNIFGVDGTNSNGNQYNIDLSTVYVGLPSSTDGQYKLKPGSPAIKAGTDNVDCGAFGNIDPYVLSGLPAVPHIFNAIIGGSGSSNSGLPVHIKAKSQN